MKILRDPGRPDKQGNPSSKGLGFAEFESHEHALVALRQLNNNPTVFGQGPAVGCCSVHVLQVVLAWEQPRAGQTALHSDGACASSDRVVSAVLKCKLALKVYARHVS